MLQGLISGFVIGLIAYCIGQFSMASLRRECLVGDDNSDFDTFEYKGKKYDKNKYIQLRVNMLSELKLKKLENMLQNIRYKDYPEYAEAEREAIGLALQGKRAVNPTPGLQVSISCPASVDNQVGELKTPTSDNDLEFCKHCGLPKTKYNKCKNCSNGFDAKKFYTVVASLLVALIIGCIGYAFWYENQISSTVNNNVTMNTPLITPIVTPTKIPTPSFAPLPKSLGLTYSQYISEIDRFFPDNPLPRKLEPSSSEYRFKGESDSFSVLCRTDSNENIVDISFSEPHSSAVASAEFMALCNNSIIITSKKDVSNSLEEFSRLYTNTVSLFQNRNPTGGSNEIVSYMQSEKINDYFYTYGIITRDDHSNCFVFFSISVDKIEDPDI